MKINFTRILATAAAVCLFSCAWTQITIVKQDGDKIYLDTSVLNRNVSVGDTFKIIVSQEKLTNPKTGKELGLINHYSPEGKIIEVQPLYVIGELPKAPRYDIGTEAVISFGQSVPAAAHQSAQTTNAQPPTSPVASRKINTWPVLDKEIISAVKANIYPRPGEEIAVLDTKGNLTVYADEQNTLQEIAAYTLPAWKKPISLSALDVMGNGTDQLFVSLYDKQTQRIETLVLQSADGQIKKLFQLPYFAKELGCGKEKEIYAQKPFVSGTKAGKAHELEYKKDHFILDKDSFATRGQWLTGMNYYEIQNDKEDNVVSTDTNGKIRLRLSNGRYAESPALFASTPNRVKYKQDILSFYPSLQVYGPEGRATLAGVENINKLGILSEQFAQYSGSKIHFMAYENGRLSVQETIPLDGFVYDTNCTQYGILIPQIISGGQTVLTEIYR